MCPFNEFIREGWELSYLRGLMNQVSYTMVLLRIMLRIILSRPCYNYYLDHHIMSQHGQGHSPGGLMLGP